MSECVVCGGAFTPKNTRQRCCYQCPGGKFQQGRFYVLKTCQVCAAPYHTSVFSQRTCSQACGVQLGNRRRELTAGALELAERLDDARVANTPVSVTALRRRLTWAEAQAITRCPTCTGRILREPEEDGSWSLTCLACGRVFGQVRPASNRSKLGWTRVLSPS